MGEFGGLAASSVLGRLDDQAIAGRHALGQPTHERDHVRCRRDIGPVAGHLRPHSHGGPQCSLHQFLSIITADKASGQTNQIEPKASDPEFSPGAMTPRAGGRTRRCGDTDGCRRWPQRGDSRPEERCAIRGVSDRPPCRSDESREGYRGEPLW